MSFRNNVAMSICNWTLLHIADEEYCKKIDLLIKQGQLHAGMGGPYILEKEPDDDAS